MRELLTADDIASEIRLTRGPSFSGAFLIVEGETSDLRVYGRLIDRELCRIIPSHGKENAIHVLEILESENFAGVLAIVDADFWRLEGRELPSSNLFITDTHDLETMILKSPALDKLLTEFGSADKIERFIERLGKSIRDVLLDSGTPIGYLRWISQKEGLSLRFEGIVFSRFLDDEALNIDDSEMITEVKNKSQRHDLRVEDLRNSIDELANTNHDPWDICCGHDLVCILSFGFRKALGSKTVGPELIETSLRLAYEATYFLVTQLYKSLRVWEKANQPFRIFPNAQA